MKNSLVEEKNGKNDDDVKFPDVIEDNKDDESADIQSHNCFFLMIIVCFC
jgi:hypothetical protein